MTFKKQNETFRMFRFLIKLLALSALFLISILIISSLPPRKEYIYYKLSTTQYEKLVWLDYHFNQGKLKNGDFDIVLIGSSSVLYGFYDSVASLNTINLGVNTGCRAMELYLLERFIKSGNKTKQIIKGYYGLDAKNFDHYGLHPVLHYFVSPIWLFHHNQFLIQPHMFSFIMKRSRVVFQSWFNFHTKSDYEPNYTSYGHRTKLHVISESRYRKSINEVPTADKESFGVIKSWYHNCQSQKSFRIQTDKLAEKHCKDLNYIYFPTLGYLRSQSVENANFKDKIDALEKKIGRELNLLYLGKDFVENRKNWSDPGHYTLKGSRTFSDSLIRYYSQLK